MAFSSEYLDGGAVIPFQFSSASPRLANRCCSIRKPPLRDRNHRLVVDYYKNAREDHPLLKNVNEGRGTGRQKAIKIYFHFGEYPPLTPSTYANRKSVNGPLALK